MHPLQTRAGQLLEELSTIAAVAGREERLRGRLKELLSGADELVTDALGNLTARLVANAADANPPPKVMLAAHMDEIGLLVTAVEESGALRVTPVGGVDVRNVLAAQVAVHTREGALPGVVGTVPPHLTKEKDRSRLPSWDDIFIDVGLAPETVKERVRPGDWVSFDRSPARLLGGRYTGKALDNRAGLVSALLAFELLRERKRPADVYLVATAQEEVGMRGATVAANALSPDVALAIDVGFASAPGLSKRETIEMGKGPAVAVGANAHPGVRELLFQVAEDRRIPVQIEAIPASSGTDAWAIQVANQGVPTGIVSIALRYMHSTVEVVDVADIVATAELVAGFCEKLTSTRMGGWRGEVLIGPVE